MESLPSLFGYLTGSPKWSYEGTLFPWGGYKNWGTGRHTTAQIVATGWQG